jgi:hypothetical protein
MKLNTFKLGSKFQVLIGMTSARKDPVTDEYPIPAYATTVPALEAKDGYQQHFKNNAWHYIVDNIGTEYWLADGSKHTITELGEALPEGALLEEPPKPEPTFEEHLASTIAQREVAYKTESDPLYMEWQYDDTAEAKQKWRDKVAEIKERYPLPTE